MTKNRKKGKEGQSNEQNKKDRKTNTHRQYRGDRCSAAISHLYLRAGKSNVYVSRGMRVREEEEDDLPLEMEGKGLILVESGTCLNVSRLLGFESISLVAFDFHLLP